MAEVPWPMQKGIAALLPTDTKALGKEVELNLIPYGCTDLRMTLMPLVKK